MKQPVRAFIALGGNLGDPVVTLYEAIRELDRLPSTRMVRASQLYRSAAWGVTEQPDFINAVALLETSLDARTLLDAMLVIERSHGRDRDVEARWGPRTLDLDLLLYGDAVIDEPGLRVPHPHLHERAFVLLPLAEIAADAMIPGQGAVRELTAAIGSDAIEVLDNVKR
ncbi:MAG: 2-amino-4-hydroxy-6-hydroxymethyldihydropteridine diphosphokinase [Pseudomonadota bacterium]|nr:2-amino-4-hydroxy-6-hydroxymethyldihydropteridine diphosphokinase [Pseudomonadota bacterium]MDQ3228435.1 2-amino-4-hydroxy-6-hydroxymethyldihydropteridine diphosphokinase [Pseudomonadota bacterium]